MISDAKFEVMHNFMANFGSITGATMMLSMGEALGGVVELIGGVASALEGGSTDLVAEAKANMSESLREWVADIRSGGVPPEDVAQAKAKLTDAHVEEVEQLFARHKLGLPPLTQQLSEAEFVAWVAAVKDPQGPFEAFTDDMQQVLGKIFGALEG